MRWPRGWSRAPSLPEGGWPAQRVLITGASGGIGQALVDEFAAAGAQLLVTGRRGEALDALVARHSGQVTAMTADLTRPEDRAALIGAAATAGCNMLVNAAGMNRVGLFESCSDEEIDRLVTLNLTATLQLTRALMPMLLAARHGWVVNLGSTFGTIGYPGQVGYCATKFALRGFSQALRRELADTRVRVLHVSPRATRTAMNAPEVEAMNQALGNAMDAPARVASAVCRAIEHGREETQLGGPERLFTGLNSLLPSLVDQALARQLPVIRRFVARPGETGPRDTP
ncbi:MAG: SDR family oxidoreductase [Halomonas sp.]|uniref:SDR family oxidoreductase n=1 Tax=Halomonas sp. TaxID=1486246 RepID=UPI00287084F4|nr:SDR family oxidoreductase [Halomonas sp.]MDR9438140.1 SDR family oxidoreductase [Halomonas sp.]